MLNQTTQETVCAHPTDRVHTPTHTLDAAPTRTVYYWNDGSLYWLPDGEEARRAERFEIYGETYKAAVPADWTDDQITAHLQTMRNGTLKLYSAIYLTQPPAVTLPEGVAAISHPPHVTLSVFQSADIKPQVIEQSGTIEISHSIYAIYGGSTQQIMLVCPVITAPAGFMPSFIPPQDDRFYHVTIGVVPMTDENKLCYPHFSKVLESAETSSINVDRLVIEPFNPVYY